MACCICYDALPGQNTRTQGYVTFACGNEQHAACRSCYDSICTTCSGSVRCPLCRAESVPRDVLANLQLSGTMTRQRLKMTPPPQPVLTATSGWRMLDSAWSPPVMTTFHANGEGARAQTPVAYVHPSTVGACIVSATMAGCADTFMDVAHVRDVCMGLARVAPDLRYLHDVHHYYCCTLSFSPIPRDGKVRVSMCWVHEPAMLHVMRALKPRYSTVSVAVADVGQPSDHVWVMPTSMTDPDTLLPAQWLRQAAAAKHAVSDEALLWVRSRALMTLQS